MLRRRNPRASFNNAEYSDSDSDEESEELQVDTSQPELNPGAVQRYVADKLPVIETLVGRQVHTCGGDPLQELKFVVRGVEDLSRAHIQKLESVLGVLFQASYSKDSHELFVTARVPERQTWEIIKEESGRRLELFAKKEQPDAVFFSMIVFGLASAAYFAYSVFSLWQNYHQPWRTLVPQIIQKAFE